MLTTKDNPFDPFEQFISWYLFDMEKGYDCCGRLDRILAKNGFSAFKGLSQQEMDDATDEAIEEIIDNDVENIYIKTFRTRQED